MPQIPKRPKRSRTRIVWGAVGGLIALFIGIQFIPYGQDHTGRSATNPFKWSSPKAEAIARASCYDCHSSEGKWWWAVKIAPFSWLAQHDIDGAQRRVNFSEWKGALTAIGIQHAINGKMPPLRFTLLHPSAKLTDADKQTLVQGFQASLTDNESPVVPSDTTAIINARCSSCHSPAPVLRFHAATAEQAKTLIKQMVQRGANVSAAEEQALIARFTR